MDSIITRIDPGGHTYSYEYDSRGRTTKMINPDGTFKQLEFNDAYAWYSDFSHNTMARFWEHTHIMEMVRESKKQNGTLIRSNMKPPSIYTHREMSVTRRIWYIAFGGSLENPEGRTDAASRKISVTYPDQSIITNEYDALNQLTSIPGHAQFTYDNDSLLTGMTYGNGTVTSFQYDSCHMPLTIHLEKNDPLLTMNYQYDPERNITQVDYSRSRGQEWVQSTEIFTYDWLGRLISAQGDYGLQSYSYDPAGNRLSLNGLTYSYNNMNELLSISDGTIFTYDDMGNSLTKTKGTDTWAYAYNKKNMLTQVEKNEEIIAQYMYNGNGERVQKTEWIESLQEYQTRIYVYSGSQVIYEKNVDTGQEATYIYGPTGRIAKRVGELVDYYYVDHLGSTRLITDESGTIVSEMCYDPFGEPLLEGEQDYSYTGKERDMSTGLYYFGARYYDPKIGRFMTRDTVEGDHTNPQTLNQYSYCRNNPLVYLDSDGRMEKKFAIAGTKSSHPYCVYGVPPEQNTYGLLLSVPITGDKVVRVEGCFIKHYDSQNITSSESVPLWAPSSTNVSVVALQIECNETMMEAEISLTAEGEFVFVGLQETESGEIIKITAKIYPKSEGEVILEFSFEVWAPGQEVEIKITLFPSTIALLPSSDDELREEWEVTVPAGDGPTAA